MNYRPPQNGWSAKFDFMPDDLWGLILLKFILLRCDGFGFEYMVDPADLDNVVCFVDAHPNGIGTVPYPDYIPRDQYIEDILIFELDRVSCSQLLSVPFTYWSRPLFDGAPAGNLIFFKSKVVHGQADWFSQSICLSCLSLEDVEIFKSLDSRIPKNIQIREMDAG